MNKTDNIVKLLWKFRGFRYFCGAVVVLALLLVSLFFTFTKVVSSDNIDYPKVDHLHFRMQYIYHGDSLNFADSKFQQPYEKNQCSGGITDNPVHFHDGKGQIVHVHWANITGGQVLKYYGLNYIGGFDDILGYRWDKLKSNLKVETVPIFGKLLPLPNKDDNLYIYSGDKENYTKRNTDDFIKQDLEKFFGQKSLLTSYNPLGGLSVEAQSFTDTAVPTEDELKQINNLIGNVIIFVQKDQPDSQQVKDSFDKLEPLSLSTCGG